MSASASSSRPATSSSATPSPDPRGAAATRPKRREPAWPPASRTSRCRESSPSSTRATSPRCASPNGSAWRGSRGDAYEIQFLHYRFSFNADDFEQRVTAAAVKLGLVADNELSADETADLVELVERDWIEDPRSGLGRYLVRHWERISLVEGESLVYWLKKLVFRGAWLDHRVKEGLLEVAWDEEVADFGYRDPNGDRALLELAPVPSWHELQFRR